MSAENKEAMEKADWLGEHYHGNWEMWVDPAAIHDAFTNQAARIAELTQENSEMARMLAEPPARLQRIAELEAELGAQNLKLATIEMRLLLCTRIAGWDEALSFVLERYCWRPIAEIHEDYGDCVLVHVEDPGHMEIGSVTDLGFDEFDWTHFTRFAPITQAEYERMKTEAGFPF